MVKFKTFIVLLLFVGPVIAEGSTLYVVSNGIQINSLEKKRIKQIYMEGGWMEIKPLSLAQGHKLRTIFNSNIIGLTESRINSYWAQMTFSGRATPPKEFDNLKDLMSHLINCPGCIAYLPSDITIPKPLNVVYTLEYD